MIITDLPNCIAVDNQTGQPMPNHVMLWAFLAWKAGYRRDFSYHVDEGVYTLIDASCEAVPDLSELTLKSPHLIGYALGWLANNQ